MDNMKYAHDLLKSMMGSMNKKQIPPTINHMSMVNAALRPSGKSYRDKLVNGEINKNPSEEIDELLKDNNGFLIFQEDTIKFLKDVCGFSGSMADTTRRAIGKKDIELLNEQLPIILEGYCSNSKKERSVAEKEAKQFIQIVSDSSDYQFGYNHSTGYSMVGYMASYARTYFPLEFVTSYFNWCENDDDYANGMKMIEEYNIKLNKPTFRKSKGEYFFDRKTNSIYKGIGSIKYMNNKVGEELYQLKDNTYNDFVDLLQDVSKISCNSRQLDILIKIGFFEEFGSVKKLLEIVEVFNLLYKRKTVGIDKVSLFGLDGIDMNKYASNISEKTGKETKTWKIFDIIGLIKDVCGDITNDEYETSQLISWQNEILGYVVYTNDKLEKRYGFVQKVDGIKGTRKVKVYCLNNGKTADFKVSARLFSSTPFKEGDIIYTTNCERRFKQMPVKDEEGNIVGWDKTKDLEWWITDYRLTKI